MQISVVRRPVFFKEDDHSEPALNWLNDLKKKKRHIEYAKITTRIDRAAQGNFGDYRMLGGAFGELRIDYGPGYRVYFGLVGTQLIVLLSGGTKENQHSDIELAKSRWEKYLAANGKEVFDARK